MKRYIKTAKFIRIDQVNFVNKLIKELQKDTTDLGRIQASPRYDLIRIEPCLSDDAIQDLLINAILSLGYDIHLIDSKDIAAIDGEAFALVSFERVDWDDYFEVYINCNTGNIILEDWYDDYEDRSVSSSTSINSATVADVEMPAGFLRTSKFSAPSIRTDDQRNVLEAIEIAISQKFKQFDDFMNRQFYLTSDTSWEGTVYQYPEGYYISLEGTRSGFQAFVSGDNVIRKPRRLSDKIGEYTVSGSSGQVRYISKNRA